jgi:hypothetical protein
MDARINTRKQIFGNRLYVSMIMSWNVCVFAWKPGKECRFDALTIVARMSQMSQSRV